MQLPNGLFKERTPNQFFLDTAHLYTPENSHGTITNITQLEKENHGKSSNQSNPNLHFWGWTMLKHFLGLNMLIFINVPRCKQATPPSPTITYHHCHLFSRRGGLHTSGAFFFHEGLDQTLQHLAFDPIWGGWSRHKIKSIKKTARNENVLSSWSLWLILENLR